MFTFIEMEFLKLKRSKIFLLSLLGAVLPPLLMFIAVTSFDEGQTFEALFTNVNMYMSAMFAVLIFAIIISYLFGREYNEHTLKTMLTIPVSREKFLASKYIMFLVWIVILTVVTSISTLAFGFAAGLDGFSLKIFADGFAQLLYANVLLFLSFSPFVFVSLFITNMVPAMIGGAGLALVNLMVYGQNWAPFVPWVCPYLIASGEIAEYSTSITVSYGVILATFVIGLVISYIYFTKMDVSI
ncbi:MAG: bacitracin ABC transporter permease [Methanobrevibacter thaueri]|jgi:ABC-2 type transport system permease protein/bacitracin transport system permease protein|uniref:ABC transporter permease n=1 Tax=Methanobrevibacter thaueri TaxID=190975 RepID=UPI0026EA9B07|nr:ABC transporter permease [Methanobrevibacter thaueri]MBE6496170.1 bacitracin ABC transporter permease [Methanobrevibacter thaueri]